MAKKIKGKGKEKKGSGGLLDDLDVMLKIEGHTIKKSATGNKYLEVELVGADKVAGKRHFWHNFNLFHSDKEVKEANQGYYDHLIFCCLGEGSESSDTKDLHKKNVMARISIQKATKKQKKKGWKDQNKIDYFFPVGGKKKKGKKGKGKDKDVPF